MAAKVVNEAVIYEEFEPFCKWQRNEDRDILEIHLPEFKKEQLKVQISNHGILKISGERPLDASKHTKFYKEVPVPSTNYDTPKIHAKFVTGNLILTLPKVKVHLPKIDEKMSPSELSKTDKTSKSGPTTGEAPVDSGPKEHTSTPKEKALTKCQLESRKRPTMGRKMAKVAVSVAATVAAMAVLIAYVVYMYKSTVAESIDD